MNTQLAEALRTAADYLLTAAQEAEIATIPRGGHFVYGTATGAVVRLECNGLVAGCPVIEGTYGRDLNALSIPARYGTQPGAEPGMPILVYLDGVYRATVVFEVMGLTELDL